MWRWGISGGCVLLAVFCTYGFVASGELSGASRTAWKAGYAILGGIALVTAGLQGTRRN